MRRLFIDLMLEDGDTMQSIAKQLDIDVEDLQKMNPNLNRWLNSTGENIHLMRVQVKLSKLQAYYSSLRIGY